MRLDELISPLLLETSNYFLSFETVPIDDNVSQAIIRGGQWTSKIINDFLVKNTQTNMNFLVKLETQKFIFDYDIMVKKYLIDDKTALN